MLVRHSGSIAPETAWPKGVVTPARVLGKAVRVFLVLALIGHILLLLVVLLASVALRSRNPSSTALMAYRKVTQHEAIRPVRFVPLRQIPRAARGMVLRLEDYRFYQHPGVDLGALRDAYRINRSLRATVVGGSTIPMQLARNLFLTPRKTYFRKYLESIIALEMDLIVPKNRILEIYLNYIEWGKGIFGIGEAASFYYHTPVPNLTLDQLRRLITIITNPLRLLRFHLRAQPPDGCPLRVPGGALPRSGLRRELGAPEPPPPAVLSPDTTEEQGAPAQSATPAVQGGSTVQGRGRTSPRPLQQPFLPRQLLPAPAAAPAPASNPKDSTSP